MKVYASSVFFAPFGIASMSNQIGAPSLGRRMSTTTPFLASLARLAAWEKLPE
ncbi:hypothetical protein D3C72_2421160 [compost metagenome]